MNEKKIKRKMKEYDTTTSRFFRHPTNLEKKIVDPQLSLLSGSLNNVFSSQVRNRRKTAKRNIPRKLEQCYKRSQRIRSKVSYSPHVIHKKKSKSIIKEINDKYDELSKQSSGIIFNNIETTCKESFDETINKPKQKSIFKEINDRYAKLAVGINKQTEFGTNKISFELNPVHESESGCTKLSFCDTLREQLFVNLKEKCRSEVNKCIERVRTEIKNTNLILEGKKQMEINAMNTGEKYNSLPTKTGLLFSPKKWVFITPPKQRLQPPQLEGSTIETGIICIEKNEKQLYELKPSYKNCSFVFSKNKVAMDNKFVQVGNFRNNSDNMYYSMDNTKNFDTSTLYSKRSIELELPSTSKIIRKPTKCYFKQPFNGMKENCSHHTDKIKMNIADIDLDNSQESSIINSDGDFEMQYSDKYKKRNTEEFASKKESRKFFSFNSQPLNIFQCGNEH